MKYNKISSSPWTNLFASATVLACSAFGVGCKRASEKGGTNSNSERSNNHVSSISVSNGSVVVINGQVIEGNGCSSNLEGSREIQTKSYSEITDLNILRHATFSGSMNVTVDNEVGGTGSITITAEQRIIDNNVKVTQSGGEIDVGLKGCVTTNTPIQVNIALPHSLTTATFSGSGDAKITDLNSNTFSLNLNGSGDVSVHGRTEQLEVNVNGSGDVDATRLAANHAQVDISGASEVRVRATNTVALECSGAGDISVSGGARIVKQRITGACEVDLE